jgi:hypothetical protein
VCVFAIQNSIEALILVVVLEGQLVFERLIVCFV